MEWYCRRWNDGRPPLRMLQFARPELVEGYRWTDGCVDRTSERAVKSAAY